MTKNTVKLCFAVILFSALFFSSCKNRQVDPAAKYRSKLTAVDTTSVVSMANAFMDVVKGGDLDQGLSMLKTLDKEGNLIELDDAKKKSIHSKLTTFPVLDYTMKSYEFSTRISNPITYRIKFAEDPETGTPYMTGFALNAVKIKNEWVLTIL